MNNIASAPNNDTALQKKKEHKKQAMRHTFFQ